MRTRIFAFILLALGVAQAGARAQNPDVIGVVRGAAAFVRDSLPKGLLAVDASLFDATRPLAPEVSDLIATEMGLKKARLRDLYHCTTPAPSQRPVCTIGGYAAVLGFSQPVVRSGSATVFVSWTYQLKPTRLAGRELQLELSRTATGMWQVTRVLSDLMS